MTALSDFRTFLVQLLSVLAAARLIGALARRVGQPQVVGEMIAGILLGPSGLGRFAPALSRALFPPESLPLLGAVSQLGLVLFLFSVGLGHRPALLSRLGKAAVLASVMSVFFPFGLGVALAWFLSPRVGLPAVGFWHFALFFGTSMSITAFPVLARILQEHGLAGSRLGVLAITCAAVDDVVGWTLVAGLLVLLRAGASPPSVWVSALSAGAWAAFLLGVGRRVLARWVRGPLTADRLALALGVAFASACITEWIGIHPIFGAFLAGVAMPRQRGFAAALRRQLEDVTIVVLLPLFFAWSGLRTQVGLIRAAADWGYLALIVATAVSGKLAGAALGALLGGAPRREAIALGVLVNTRGLVELVVLNLGLSAGVISPSLFTLLVLMAMVTTVMTAPLLRACYPHANRS